MVAIGLLLAWAARTSDQTRVWHSDLSLWTQAVAVSPLKPRPWINLGRALEADQRPAEASQAYHAAVRLSLDRTRPAREQAEARAVALTNLGRLAVRAGDRARGLGYLDAATDAVPEFAPALFQRALAWALMGQCSRMAGDLADVRRITGMSVVVPCEPS